MQKIKILLFLYVCCTLTACASMEHAKVICNDKHGGLGNGSPAYFQCKDDTVWVACDGGYCDMTDRSPYGKRKNK